MPAPVSWTLIGGTLSATPAVGGTGTLTALPPPLTSYVQQDFLDLFDRLFPLHWLSPLKDPGPGYEMLQTYAKLAQRISEAVCRFGAGALITSAGSGAYATGNVVLVRDLPNALVEGGAATVASVAGGEATITGLVDMAASMVGSTLTLSDCYTTTNNGSFIITAFLSTTSVKIANAAAIAPDGNDGNIDWWVGIPVTVKTGTVLTCSRGGQDFVTTEDVTFQPGTRGPFTVAIKAVAQGFEWNVPGEVLALDGLPLSGDIDTIKSLVEEPPLGDLSIQVQHFIATSGGADATLDALGADRGITRLSGEGDDDYRTRIGQLPDTVSPGAIARACKAVFEKYGAAFSVIETWDVGYQTCWDASGDAIAGSSYDPNLFVYDDPRPTIPFRNRWLDESEYRGCFIVVASDLTPMADYGMAFDDTASSAGELYYAATQGNRAPGAFDTTSADAAFGYTLGCFDGYDAPKAALFLGLWTTLQQIKAAGVVAVVERNGA